jgi:DNA-binding transcriptional regulator YhcF (GntR family)
MSERGVFAMDRGWFDHPCFAPEPYTEREAWAWLISQAAYKAHTRRIGNITITLKRGQLTASVRFLAEKWQWHRNRVDRFLRRLHAERMIGTDAGQGINVITICNYSKYQRVSLPDDEQIGTATGQQRDKGEYLESQELDRGRSRAREAFQISPDAFAFADELAIICGQDPKFLTPEWISSEPATRAQMWLNAGWRVDVMREQAKLVVRKKRDGAPQSVRYFEKVFARAHTPQLPLPVVKIVHTEEVVNVEQQRASSSNVVQAGLRRVAEFRELAGRVGVDGAQGDAAEGGFRSGAGDPHVRVLAQDGS